MTALIQGIASGFGARAELAWITGPPALLNTPEWADFAQQQAAQSGYRAERAEVPLMGGEDFAFTCSRCRGHLSVLAVPVNRGFIIRPLILTKR